MSRYNAFFLYSLISINIVSFAQSKTVTITGIKNIQDTVLFSGDTGKNSNVTTELRAGMSGPNNPGIHRSLIRFNLSSIPSNAVISAVTVQLICTRIPKHAETVSVTQEFHRVISSWAISKKTSSATPTWLFCSYPSLKWTTPGGDFVDTPSASVIVNKIGTVIWTSQNLTADVQGWVKKTFPNYGWILLGDEKVSRSVRNYGSSEDTANSPTLYISFFNPRQK